MRMLMKLKNWWLNWKVNDKMFMWFIFKFGKVSLHKSHLKIIVFLFIYALNMKFYSFCKNKFYQTLTHFPSILFLKITELIFKYSSTFIFLSLN